MSDQTVTVTHGPTEGITTSGFTLTAEWLGSHHPSWPDGLRFSNHGDAERWYFQEIKKYPAITVRRRYVSSFLIVMGSVGVVSP